MGPASPDIVHAPTLQVYYTPTCVPCRLELPAVAEYAETQDARVQVVIIGYEARARVGDHH